MSRAGTVYLVGAGPGDPGLMTARALELIATADVIFYDRLIPPGALDGAHHGAELLYVGKEPGEPTTEQEDIEALLVEHARAGRQVVRLKGGDPFVFGRGGEEAEHLAQAGIPFEVVPGVSAGVAAPAYAGIPVTHREDASAVAFVTGHEDPAKEVSALDWNALASFPGTLVFYMGVKRVALIAERLIGAGRHPAEPVAVIHRGSTPGQKTVAGRLADIGRKVSEAGLRPPAVILVGEVVRHRDRLAWFERRPLFGLRVVVTRAQAQASELTRRLTGLGAEAIEAPAIRIEPMLDDRAVADAVGRLAAGDYTLVCLTSANGARLLFEALSMAAYDARVLAGATLAAIGPGTAAALAEHGITADIVPPKFVAESLVEALRDLELEGRRVLVARAAQARDVLPDALRQRGAEVDVVSLYETAAEEVDDATLAAIADARYVTFTSSSTVTNFIEATGGRLPESARVVSIGPITSKAARDAGLDVHVEAERHDIDGLVDALIADSVRRPQ